MSINKGRRFEKEITKSLQDLSNKGKIFFYYKIPDVPRSPTFRFLPEKPFDILVVVNGKPIGLELKCESVTYFALNRVRKSQLEMMERLKRAGGQAFFLINFRFRDAKTKKRVNSTWLTEFEKISRFDLRRKSIPMVWFEEERCVQIFKKEGIWDLSPLLSEIEKKQSI